MKSEREGASNTMEEDVKGEVRRPSYRAKREGARAKAKQEADRGCKEGQRL